jgi:serine protease
MRRPVYLLAAVLALTAASVTVAASTPPIAHSPSSAEVLRGSVHRLAIKSNPPPARIPPLYSHGGLVETVPAVYVSYWGPEWITGFSTNGIPSSAAQTYVNDFLGGIGGNAWANSMTQYCQGVISGTACPSTAAFVTNPANQLAGVWEDPSLVPVSPSQTDIANAAVRLEQHFGYNANATYFVLSPSGKSETGFGTSWCAWHAATSVPIITQSPHGNKTLTTYVPLAFAYVPYQPDAGSACGMNFVNTCSASHKAPTCTNGPLDQGYFDGFSIVAGHEYAEAITDPVPIQGWGDQYSRENGDKCAWSSVSANVAVGSNYFAVQPLWSNGMNAGAGGCAMS